MRNIFVLILLFSCGTLALNQIFMKGKTLTPEEVSQRWGNEKYDAQKFRDGDPKIKAKMSYSILTDKTLIGKSYTDIRNLFGPPDGFYFIDTYPAYIIQDGKNRDEEAWQIVFRIGNGYKVRDIIVHKNCCEK